MTSHRLNLLLTGLLFLALAALILMPYCSHAAEEVPIDWHVSGYAVTNYSGAKYYSQGFGGQVEAQAKWRFVELYGSGKLLSQKKKTSESGYVYGLNGQVRLFYNHFFALGAWNYSGYRSTFADGSVWSKRGNRYGGGLGARFRLPDDWGGNEIEAWLTIYAKEHDTPNQCQDNTLDLRMQIWGPVYGLIQVTYGTWDQGDERWSGWGESVGLGVKW